MAVVGSGRMALKDKLMAEGMKLAGNPQVAKLMQDERFMKLVMTAMSMPGKVSTFTTEQKEHFAAAMGLATQEEVRDLKRTVAALERAVARLETRRP
jgi:cell division FtsZ-interacting protein ZapD